MRRAPRLAVTLLLWAACVRPQLPTVDPGLSGLALLEVHPGTVVPGSQLDLVGAGFVDPALGAAQLELRGTFTIPGGGGQPIDLRLAARFVDGKRLASLADAAFFAGLPAAFGHFDGEARVLVDSTLDGALHASDPLPVSLDVAGSLQPKLTAISGGTLYVNGAVAIDGSDFLLGGGEGETHVVVSGCFTPNGSSAPCQPVAPVDLIALPVSPWDRAHVQFAFAPAIAGITPGRFDGTVRVENRPAGAAAMTAGSQPLSVVLKRPAILQVAPTRASLGQYLDVRGGGFIGAATDEVTLLHLSGSFTASGQAQAAPVDLKLVARFVSGSALRYVLDESDALGQVIDLRRAAGTFVGSAEPITRKRTTEIVGDRAQVTIAIAPVKQVVYLRFAPSYVDSLRLYGLVAADRAVRDRVLAVAARDYAGVNVELREEAPTDFALYSQVDVVGPDANGLGLFGYDNTPGKDVGNQRLFDRIGGINAQTQSDGFPGYGGVFASQFFGFSQHPVAQVAALDAGDTHFDAIFDAVRPDTGTPITDAEAAFGIAASDGSNCPAPAGDRVSQISCAVFVLGNLIGTTLTHELGHSLGLADPTGELFHDPGDRPNRLMDAGSARPFDERAELFGQGPGRFCTEEVKYLTTILAGAGTPDPGVSRPSCAAP